MALLEEVNTAIEAGDLMEATALILATMDAARRAGAGDIENRMDEHQDLYKQIRDLERASEPAVIPKPLADLICCCETFCVAACCGTNAFDLREVERWVRETDRRSAAQTLAQIQSVIANMLARGDSVHVLWSDLFEVALSPPEWRRSLGTWERHLALALEAGT